MKKRWESYVMYRQNKKLVEFWKEYYKDRSAVKVLFLLGKGFDPRMNNILKLFLENNPEQQLDCIAFDFPNEKDPKENKKLYEINSRQLAELKDQYGFGYEELQIDGSLPWDKRIAQMSRQVIGKDLSAYNDVIMDYPEHSISILAKHCLTSLTRTNLRICSLQYLKTLR